jgi:predicted small metal-binding protein
MTGRARGLLCHKCNRSIATADDKPEVLRRLADYLEKYSGGREIENVSK